MKATTALLTLLAAAGPLASGRYILNRENHHHRDSTPTTIPTGTAVPWPTGLRPTGTGNGALRPTAGPGDGGGGEGGAWVGWQRVRTRVSEPVYGRPGAPVAGA